MKRLAKLSIIGLVGLASACSALKPHADQLQAEQRWNHVRGRVKHQLAEQQYESGLFDEAVLTVSESLALNPAQVDAYVLLARAYLELGKPASAQQTLDAARQAGLESADLVYTEGVVLEQRDEFETALGKYHRAQTLDPANVDYLVALAECLVATDRTAEALALLNQHANQVDEDATISALAAHIAALMGKSEDAANRFRRSIRPEGSTSLIAEELGLLLARSGRCFEALTVLQPLLDNAVEAPATGAVRRAAATCFLAVSDPDSAKDVLAAYARVHPDDTSAQLLLAKAAIQWKRGDFAAAAASLHDVLAHRPDDIEAHCLMAEVLLAQHKNESARRYFQKALQLNPKCTWASRALESLG